MYLFDTVMYTDTLLFIAGGVCAALALISLIHLVASRKRGKLYKNVLRQETEFLDVLSSTYARGDSAPDTPRPVGEAARTVFSDMGKTVFSNSGVVGFDASALEGRYIIKSEIQGGGMSRVFLAESAKLGNEWIVKFISNERGGLANEENILKLLNHNSLPKIIDIFHDTHGVYIVESFIEGVSLDKVQNTGLAINQVILLEWAGQLAQVLGYLHQMEPHPIYHFDIKPKNIIVTHNNQLSLIDFGISKRYGADGPDVSGLTYRYAAPEQLGRAGGEMSARVTAERFGEGGLPVESANWQPDARTDIYCLGLVLYELATGQSLMAGNTSALRDTVPEDVRRIIETCVAVNPDDRYQSAALLLADLHNARGTKIKIVRTLFTRRLAAVSCVFAVAMSGGSFSGGYYVYTRENAATLELQPRVVTVSLQQSSDLTVEKRMPDGEIVALDNAGLRWSSPVDNIARIDGNRVLGINVGRTELSGSYRDKRVALSVKVVPPMDGMVDISAVYRPDRAVSLYAGSTEREHIDGSLADAEFVAPESIAVAGDGTVYVADSGSLRRIRRGGDGAYAVDSVNFEPGYLTPRLVRCDGDGVYVLTHEWEDDDGVYYGIIRLTDAGAEGLYMADAKFTAVEDFAFGKDGLIYFVDRNAGADGVFLKTLNPAGTADINMLCELPRGTASLAIDREGDGSVYLANPETGALQVWRDGALSWFAGVEGERAFIDGPAPLFYMPQRLKFADNALYVWDFNVLRRLAVVSGAAGSVAGGCITLAGEASPTFDLAIARDVSPAADIVLPNSELADFAVMAADPVGDGMAPAADDGAGVLLTDPKRGVIWRVE